ncbi:hypothetical protein IGV50_004419 [Salmonella enterica subsp. enterica serovar Newport]|nr:hypothetical protein [Salmonella enterica subsp. enterica serovar Newport]
MGFYLNYERSDESQRFFESEHILNKVKAIIAHSFDLENANDNLRRAHIPRGKRERFLKAFGKYVNDPKMPGVPYSQLSDLWYEET